MPKKLLTIDDVAEMFIVSKPTVYRMVQSRILPFYRIGRYLRFDEGEILDYLERQRVMPIEDRFYVASHKAHPRT
jgi:excisionase family DNA binding protein